MTSFPRVIVLLVLSLLFANADAAVLSEAKLLKRSLSAIQRSYIEPERINPQKMLQASLDRISQFVPEILTISEQEQVQVTVGVATKCFPTKSLDNIKEMEKVLKDILVFIDLHYTGEVKKEEIEYIAIDGFLSALDPHSGFFSPEIYNEFQVGTKGEFGGLGIVIGIRDGYLSVIAPLEDTPAAIAGIKAQDRILQIDDASTVNMSVTDAVKLLRGSVGTNVRLVIERPGRSNHLKVSLTRATINIDSVKHALLHDGEKRFGYIKVKSFQQNTDQEFQAALQSFRKGRQNLDGLILDLRNNPGGLLEQSIKLADYFLPSGTIVSTVGAKGRVLDYQEATQRNTEPNYPLIVLINEGSASASEIVAGALQVHNRALVMGRRSFGKGSVQTVFELGDQTALKLTIAQYLAGGAKSIQLRGVTPDIELKPVTIDKEHMNIVEDKFFAESDLEQHLAESSLEEVTSSLSSRFLKPYEEIDGDTLSVQEYARKPEIDEDFAVSLAKKILLSAKGPRLQMLTSAKQVVSLVEKQQDEAITKELAKLGIDWNETPKEGKPILKVAYNIRQTTGQSNLMRAGTEASLELAITNVGSGPFSQLVGVGQSDSGFLTNKEFVFGRVDPKQTKMWSVPVKVPENLPSQHAILTVEFMESHGNKPQQLDIAVPIAEISLPHFIFSYELKEAKPSANLSSGKMLHLVLDVINKGPGASSDETVAMLTNKSGEALFLKKGRERLGEMAPEGKRRTMFEFRIDPSYGKPTVELELFVTDPKRVASVSRKLTLSVQDGILDPPAKMLHQAPLIDFSKTAVIQTASKEWLLEGFMRDDGSVKDYILFVADKKILYSINAEEKSRVPFSINVPLEPGNNLVTLAARDNEGLFGRRSIVIQRTIEKKTNQITRAGSLL